MTIDLNALLALAQTDPEYCLLWIDWWPTCMKKSEWASWVQSVGSIAAIAGAFWVAKWQMSHQSMQARLERLEALVVEAELFIELGLPFAVAVHGIRQAFEGDDPDAAKRVPLSLANRAVEDLDKALSNGTYATRAGRHARSMRNTARAFLEQAAIVQNPRAKPTDTASATAMVLFTGSGVLSAYEALHKESGRLTDLVEQLRNGASALR